MLLHRVSYNMLLGGNDVAPICTSSSKDFKYEVLAVKEKNMYSVGVTKCYVKCGAEGVLCAFGCSFRDLE